MRYSLMFCAAVLVAPMPSSGQGPADWPIAAGSRVRILSPVLGRQPVTGSVVSATADTLVFRAAADSTSTPVATPNIVGIAVARGTHNNRKIGGFAGFLAGAMVGAAIGAAVIGSPCTNCLDYSQGAGALAFGAMGGLAGGVIGASLGRREVDTWVPVSLPARSAKE